MTLLSGLAIYLVIWWIVLFAILPWGVRTQDEADEVVPGSSASAPTHPLLLRKAIATTIVSGIVFGLLWFLVAVLGVTLDDIPFLPDFSVPL